MQNIEPAADVDRNPPLDLWFPIVGNTIPVDHAYALYSGVVRTCELRDPLFARRLHDELEFGLHLIRGTYSGGGVLQLTDRSRFGVRIRPQYMGSFLKLAGQQVTVGEGRLRLGVPQPKVLVPASRLYAHLVTTTNCEDENRFCRELQDQVGALGVTASIAIGKRRTFGIKGAQIVAYSVALEVADPQDSLTVQSNGLGGRRKMGCGVFLPQPAHA